MKKFVAKTVLGLTGVFLFLFLAILQGVALCNDLDVACTEIDALAIGGSAVLVVVVLSVVITWAIAAVVDNA